MNSSAVTAFFKAFPRAQTYISKVGAGKHILEIYQRNLREVHGLITAQPAAMISAILESKTPTTVSLHSSFKRKLPKLFEVNGITRVVEIGAGGGYSLSYLRKLLGRERVELIGIDLNLPSALRREELGSQGIILIPGDARELPDILQDKKIDKIDIVYGWGGRTFGDNSLDFSWLTLGQEGPEERLAHELLQNHVIARAMTQVLSTNPQAFALQMGVGKSDYVFLEESRVAGFAKIILWEEILRNILWPLKSKWVRETFFSAPAYAAWTLPYEGLHLRDILNSESDITTLEKLSEKEFTIDAEDIILLNQLGRRQRERSGNQYNYLYETSIFLYYAIHQLRKAEIPVEDIDRIKAVLALYQKLYKTGWSDKEEIEEQIINWLKLIKVSSKSKILNIFYKLQEHLDDLIFSPLVQNHKSLKNLDKDSKKRILLDLVHCIRTPLVSILSKLPPKE